MTNLEYLKNKFPKAVSTAEILASYFDKQNIDLSINITETNLVKVMFFIVEDYFKYLIDLDQFVIYLRIRKTFKFLQKNIR